MKHRRFFGSYNYFKMTQAKPTQTDDNKALELNLRNKNSIDLEDGSEQAEALLVQARSASNATSTSLATARCPSPAASRTNLNHSQAR